MPNPSPGRSRTIDATTLALWAGATRWKGVPGFLIFYAGMIITALGTAYHQLRQGDRASVGGRS
jgi:hypothetical protein